MSGSRTKIVVALNTIYQIVGRIASAGSTFIVSLLLAKQLGPQGYGDFSKIVTYIALFYLLVDMGLNAAFLQLEEEDSRVSYRHLMGLRILAGILAAFLAVSLLVFLPQGQAQGYTPLVRLGILLYSASIISQGLITTANVLFQKNLEYNRATAAVIVGSGLTLGLVVLFGGTTVLGTICIFLAGSVVTAALSLFLAKHFATDQSPIFSVSRSLLLIKTALPLSLTLVFNVVYFRADSIILTLVRSTTEVGIYNFAYKIFELPLVFPTFFMNALFPFFLHEHLNAPEKFYRHIRRGALVLGIISIIATIGIWVMAPIITSLNPDFRPSVEVVRILALGIPFFFLSSLTMWILITLKKRRSLILIYGSSMIINICLNALLVPIYGYLAAAWITIFGEVLVLLFSVAIIFKNRPEQTIKKLSIITK